MNKLVRVQPFMVNDNYDLNVNKLIRVQPFSPYLINCLALCTFGSVKTVVDAKSHNVYQFRFKFSTQSNTTHISYLK